MSFPREPAGALAPSSPARHAEVAALPLAAALTLLVARALPVRFEYRPNDLGIVSVATLQRYPLQQETFWFVFAIGFGVAAALAFAALLRRWSWSPGRGIALEAASLATLGVLLFLPRVLAPVALGLAALIVVLARAAPLAETGAPERDAHLEPRPARRGGARAVLWALVLVVIALGMSPDLPLQIARLAGGTPDAKATADNWNFLAESGQHMAWADYILAGRMQGRDFFSLYGPYLDLAMIGLWELLGRSIATVNLYVALQFVLGYLGALALAWVLCRTRPVALAFVPLGRAVNLRFGLGLLALATLAPWLRGGARAWCGAAGLVGGVALLTSQEFGLAFLLAAAFALAVRGDLRALAWFAGGLALPVAPVLAWFLAEGAFGPLVRDMAGYPSWVAAGYGKLPFPSLLAGLPIAGSGASSWLRSAYVGPVVCASAFALATAVARVERRPLSRFPLELRRAWRARPDELLLALVALFGLVSFRSALGRSDMQHVAMVMAAPTLLLVAGLDRTLPLLAEPGRRVLGAWRLLGLFALAWFGTFPQNAASFGMLRESATNLAAAVAGRVAEPRGSPTVNQVVEWIRAHTEPQDPVVFIPAGGAYHYLTERRDPTRFVLSHQMVTDAHRAEALADMRRSPPRYVVFDPRGLRVDQTPDSVVLGAALSDWIERHYEVETVIRGVEIRGRKTGAAAPGADGAPPDGPK